MVRNKRLQITISEERKQQVERHCDQRDISVSTYGLLAIIEKMERESEEKMEPQK